MTPLDCSSFTLGSMTSPTHPRIEELRYLGSIGAYCDNNIVHILYEVNASLR